LDFFLSSLVCSFLLFRTFVMFTYTAVCLNLCSSSFSAGRSWDWTSATFPLVGESSNLSCCWSEADFSRLVAVMSFVLCPDGSQPHQSIYWMLFPCGHFILSRLVFCLKVFSIFICTYSPFLCLEQFDYNNNAYTNQYPATKIHCLKFACRFSSPESR
jgi:hypothetical protein